MQVKEYASLDGAIRDLYGESVKVNRRTSVFGGDINEAYALELSNGMCMFMKANRPENVDFFRAEAAGLSAIASVGVIKTPEILGIGADKDQSFLLLEFIKSGRKNVHFWEDFGQELAALHAADASSFVHSGNYGFVRNNYIGERVQVNMPCDTWIDFYREYRLRPQFEAASSYFSESDTKLINTLMEHLEDFLVEPESPSLLHGDLWSGNFMVGNDGNAWLIDPAVYVGHAEADLAMTELFGGFSPEFYDAYGQAGVIQDGYADRRDLYHLYQLLNHLNMFGGSYLSSVRRILHRYVGK